MTTPLSRRDAIAAQVLATVIATIEPVPRDAARTTIEYTDTLIAELDRTAPSAETPKPEEKDLWVVWVVVGERGHILDFLREKPIDGPPGCVLVRNRVPYNGARAVKVRLVPVEE